MVTFFGLWGTTIARSLSRQRLGVIDQIALLDAWVGFRNAGEQYGDEHVPEADLFGRQLGFHALDAFGSNRYAVRPGRLERCDDPWIDILLSSGFCGSLSILLSKTMVNSKRAIQLARCSALESLECAPPPQTDSFEKQVQANC
jgi:hypothetical protein